MPFGLFSFYRLYVMDDGDQPVPIIADVKNHELAHRIGMLEDGPHLLKIMPVRSLDDGLPRSDFVRRLLVGFCRLQQVLFGDDVHSPIITSQSVKLSSIRFQ